MDFISLMAYDLHGSWENITGHNSPLYAHSGETGDQRYLNMVSNLSTRQHRSKLFEYTQKNTLHYCDAIYSDTR